MKLSIQKITYIALMTAVLCVLSPLAIPTPISAVPISLSTFAIYLTLFILDSKSGLLCICVYIALGLLGLPVFSSFTGGVSVLLGPTGGYICGYIFLGIMPLFIKKNTRNYKKIVALCLGTLCCYIVGTLWLAYCTKISFQKALFIGVIPFVPLDIMKLVAANYISKPINKLLSKDNF